jgi:hypothetical protein
MAIIEVAIRILVARKLFVDALHQNVETENASVEFHGCVPGARSGTPAHRIAPD